MIELLLARNERDGHRVWIDPLAVIAVKEATRPTVEEEEQPVAVIALLDDLRLTVVDRERNVGPRICEAVRDRRRALSNPDDRPADSAPDRQADVARRKAPRKR